MTRIPTLRHHVATPLVALLVSVLAACATPTAPETRPEPKNLTLTTPGRADNDFLPVAAGGKSATNRNCRGENLSPALAWVRPPAGTQSFALLMDDQAGRMGLGVSHWVAYGIPANVSGFAEGETTQPSSKYVGGKNIVGGGTYYGPCPPPGDSAHHYVFTLIATSLEPGALKPGLTRAELLEALAGKTLGASGVVLRFAQQ